MTDLEKTFELSREIGKLEMQILQRDSEIRLIKESTAQLRDECDRKEFEIDVLKRVLDKITTSTPKNPLFEAIQNEDLTAINKILHPDHV